MWLFNLFKMVSMVKVVGIIRVRNLCFLVKSDLGFCFLFCILVLMCMYNGFLFCESYVFLLLGKLVWF